MALTFNSRPAGRTLLVHGETLTAQTTVTSWAGWLLDLEARDQDRLRCTGWSDGGASSHQVRTPASATTYTARFG